MYGASTVWPLTMADSNFRRRLAGSDGPDGSRRVFQEILPVISKGLSSICIIRVFRPVRRGKSWCSAAIFSLSGVILAFGTVSPGDRRYLTAGYSNPLVKVRHSPLFAWVKFQSRMLTAVNLRPSLATLGSPTESRHLHSSTNSRQTLRIARHCPC
jgi:hypothetical protein